MSFTVTKKNVTSKKKMSIISQIVITSSLCVDVVPSRYLGLEFSSFPAVKDAPNHVRNPGTGVSYRETHVAHNNKYEYRSVYREYCHTQDSPCLGEHGGSLSLP